ncbi:major outer membrane protein [Helicobacter apodemus]|uniref:major outer membrane protein n=1 Tax=Helicobacter apodemus TaxID=135569 RepID=UPI0013A57124|nr:major outer membrane protein [Helicobacter apodemus]
MSKKFLLILGLGIGLVSTSPAQDLQSAIKNIDVRGMLRYRYTDDRYENQNNIKDNNGNGKARHQYRAAIDFKTAPVNNISFNLGLLYHNPLQNVNHGKGLPESNPPTNGAGAFLGRGLGAGADSHFGISNFNMTLTPTDTTSIKLGKMVLNTPYSDVLHDRATGAIITNSDIQNWTFMASIFDSWSVDDIYIGYLGDNRSIDKLFFSLATLGNYQTKYGNFHTEIWGFHIKDLLKAGLYTQLSWERGIFFYNGFYSFANLDNSNTSILYPLYNNEKLNPQTNKFKNKADLFGIELGAKFHKFHIPLRVRIGYWGNTQDSYTVSLDNEGYYMSEPIGRIFFENSATGMTISMLPNTGTQTPARNESNSLNLFYINPTYEITKNLKVGIEYAYGKTQFQRGRGNDTYNAQIKFQEITPILTYQYTKQIRITAYYAMLNTKSDKEILLKTKNTSAWDDNKQSQEEQRKRFRLELRYNF